MLRKRSRSVHKEQSNCHLMSDSVVDSYFLSNLVPKTRSSSFFSVPGLFVGFTAKGLTDYDSIKSPTSPLDHKVFSNLGNPLRSPRSAALDGPLPQKSWDCNSNKVGLGIVDSLNNETNPCGKGLGFLESRNILFGSQMRINIPSCKTQLPNTLESSLTPKSLPKNYAISPFKSPNLQSVSSDALSVASGIQLEPEMTGKIRSCLSYNGRSSSLLTRLMYHNPMPKSDEFCLDTKNTREGSGSPPLVSGSPNFENSSDIKSSSFAISVGSEYELIGSLSASEIELSEDYTCVILRGPNPRTTHIYGDCILESHSIELADQNKDEWGIESPQAVKDSGDCYPSADFLSFCFSCKKKLEEGKDIYMYRGEKAFCSCNCRSQEIFVEDEVDQPSTESSHSQKRTSLDDIFLMGMDVAT